MNNEKYNQIIDEAYKSYRKEINQRLENWIDIQEDDIYEGTSLHDYTRKWTKEEFINKCKTDSRFSEKWGLKIEERELSYDERFRIAYKDLELRKKLEVQSRILRYPEGHNEVMDNANIPTKLITVTYNNETIEVYE